MIPARGRWLWIAALTAACSAPPDAEAPPGAEGEPAATSMADAACSPLEPNLVEGATLADRAGSYTLVLVEDVAGSAGRQTRGTLTLTAQQNPDLSRWDAATTPLHGSASIDLAAVGAHEIGPLDATDPEAPGVLVLEALDPAGPRLMIRFGSDANTRQRAAFDGGYTVLTVATLREDGFFGSWRSAAQGPATGGWFCVRATGA